jgi:hypothetical protein
VKGLNQLNRCNLPLRINPIAWLGCFAESKNWTAAEVHDRILKKISAEEERHIAERKKEGIAVLGEKTLTQQNFFQRYRSKRYGKCAICASTCKDSRKNYIQYYRHFCETCRAVWERWLHEQKMEAYPPGAFRPPRAPAASLFASII